MDILADVMRFSGEVAIAESLKQEWQYGHLLG